MSVLFEITTSLDGYVAGPDPTLEEPLGRNGEALHEWAFALRSWREPHGMEGGEEGPENDLLRRAKDGVRAHVMGRRMFSNGSGPWEDDPKAQGWWGDDPPYRTPVFVVTHHEREPLVLGDTTFHFVTDGVGAALERAREAAGTGDVHISGGADVGGQALAAGLVDELLIHTAPMLLGGGTRLFDDVPADIRLQIAEQLDGPLATHVRYRVVR